MEREGTPPEPHDLPASLTPGTAPHSDLANAERFACMWRGVTVYVRERGGWHCFTGRRWERSRAAVEARAQETARRLLLAAIEARDVDMEKWARRTQSARGLAAMLRAAQSMMGAPPSVLEGVPGGAAS